MMREVSVASRNHHLRPALAGGLLVMIALAVCAEAGRFDDVVRTQQKVCNLRAAQTQITETETLQGCLGLYRTGHACHRD